MLTDAETKEAEALLREAANAINHLGTDHVLRGEPRPHLQLWERICAFLMRQQLLRN